jgi:hypothetical protein
MGMFQIDFKKKTANLLSGGTAKFNTTNLATVALAIARLMSLPVVSQSGASLSDSILLKGKSCQQFSV